MKRSEALGVAIQAIGEWKRRLQAQVYGDPKSKGLLDIIADINPVIIYLIAELETHPEGWETTFVQIDTRLPVDGMKEAIHQAIWDCTPRLEKNDIVVRMIE